MTISIEYTVAQLQRRAGERQLTAVASKTGVNLRTVRRIMEGKNVGIHKIEAVEKFLRDTEKQRRIDDEPAT